MKEQSLRYELGKGNPVLSGIPNRKTAKQYTRHVDRFCKWAAAQGIKRRSHLEKAYGTDQAAVQSYADYLRAQGYTASTVHDYLVGICRAAGLSLQEIEKPRRITSDNVRSRPAAGRNRDAEREAKSGRYDGLLDFQARIGIRRAELARLTGKDLVTDVDGWPCVYVRKGKGGKPQLQRILPGDVDAVKAYFADKLPDERIFPPGIMRNHLDLHALRHDHAKECYWYYASMTDSERWTLRQDLINRYRTHAGRDNWDKWIQEADTDGGRYRLRGSSAAYARAHGLPTEYDRLAILAVSVFHLSHWRLDVTVSNYLNVA